MTTATAGQAQKMCNRCKPRVTMFTDVATVERVEGSGAIRLLKSARTGS